MTIDQLILLLLPVAFVLIAVWSFLRAKKRKEAQPPKSHGPHTPGAGYDAKEIARSKGNGMADGGIG